jgi:hypothetical protein
MAPNNGHHDHYDNTNRYAGDQAADTRRAMNHMPDEDRVPTGDLQQSINQQQAADLGNGVRMGDDRVIGDTPNWANYDSEQLYKFATDNNTPYTADDLGRSFNDGGNSLADAANGLLDAVSRLDGAWTGVAADSAKGALAPLAQAAGTAGTTAQLMGVRMSQQSVAASEVQKLPPAKTFDKQQSLNAMVTGGPLAMTADLKAQKDAADQVKTEQISYLNTYTSSMTAVDSQTPSFVPPEERITGGTGNGNSITGGNVNILSASGPPATRGTTTGGPSHKFTGVGGPNSSAPGVNGDNNGQTDQSSFTPVGMGTGSSGYTPPSATPPGGPSTFGPSGGGAGTANVPGAGSGGFGGGFGSFGSPGAGAGAGAGPGAGSGGGNPGARPMGPGGMGGPGGAGGRGAGGMGGGRGKGDKEEDKEHERPSYLVEGDPESTFGNDQMTAPPVIGGDD